jgi:hypothetical protein
MRVAGTVEASVVAPSIMTDVTLASIPSGVCGPGATSMMLPT